MQIWSASVRAAIWSVSLRQLYVFLPAAANAVRRMVYGEKRSPKFKQQVQSSFSSHCRSVSPPKLQNYI